MRTLAQRFEHLKNTKQKGLVLFVTAGDQPLSELPEILSLLESSGADAIEVGIPFSDPFGEGPTIQASSQRALDRGVTPQSILHELRNVNLTIPVVTMGYYNPILRFGVDAFARASATAGVTGTIINDLIPDESDAWCAASAAAGLETIFLAAPTSTDQRIQEAARRSTGFVYAVSRTGVTGTETSVPTDVSDLVQKIRSQTDKPICVGFGISKPEHVRRVCAVADGAVVGSALVTLLHENWTSNRNLVADWIAGLKEATKG